MKGFKEFLLLLLVLLLFFGCVFWIHCIHSAVVLESKAAGWKLVVPNAIMISALAVMLKVMTI